MDSFISCLIIRFNMWVPPYGKKQKASKIQKVNTLAIIDHVGEIFCPNISGKYGNKIYLQELENFYFQKMFKDLRRHDEFSEAYIVSFQYSDL